MKTITTSITLFFAFSGLLLFMGCAEHPFGAVRVTGTVMFDGEPMEGVNVSFAPTGGGDARDSYGLTDAQGRFVLTIPGTDYGSGAQPGEYIVTFSKVQDPMEGQTGLEGLSSEDLERELARRFPRGLPGPIDLLPARYNSRTNTPIAPVTVEQGGKNDFTFELMP